MPCIVDISPDDEVNHYQVLLCQACKYLTRDQIASLTNPGPGIHDGLQWYASHLTFDYDKRCHNNDVLDFDYDTSEKEKLEILKELNRIGYDLIFTEKWMELVELNE
jgi:hypothetical protein